MDKWKKYLLSHIWSLLLVAQIVLVFVFGSVNESGIKIVMYLGWFIWIISVVFGWLPIYIFKRKGGVKKGESYVHTTMIVESGLYSIIRHPQYTAGILFSLALILISQSWLITALGIAVIVLLYIDILLADKYELEKFGNDYKLYMKKVPRTNFILGIIRLLKQRKEKGSEK